MGLKNLVKNVIRTSIIYLAGEFVKNQLNDIIRVQIITNAVKLCLFLAAVFIFYKSIFGITSSMFIGSLIITGLLVHSLIMTLPKAISLFLTLWKYKFFIALFIGKASPSEILAYYIRLCHPWALKIKAWLDKRLNGWVPTANDLVDYVWGYLGKRLLVFGISMTVFLVSFNFFVRPMLHVNVLGIGWLKVYFLPFAMAIDFLFKTELMQLIM